VTFKERDRCRNLIAIAERRVSKADLAQLFRELFG
jgi:hypothetical protein